MKLKIYSVRDVKTEAFMNPWYARTLGEAIRSFEQGVNSPESTFHKYPDDFCMFEIGEWDDATAEIVTHEQPVKIGLASEYKRVEDNLKAV